MDCITNEEYQRILKACRNGVPCKYGVCDECPNTLGTYEEEAIEELDDCKCICCGAIISEGDWYCHNCLTTIKKTTKEAK